jgi:predicted amidohydrolase
VLADGGESPGIVMAEIDVGAVAETRRRIPSLSHDRPYSPPIRG